MTEGGTVGVAVLRYPSDGIRRGKFGAPVLSLLGGDYDELPIPEDEGPPLSEATPPASEKESGDLIGSIMFEQTKTLAPARFQKVGRDGKILETELMVEHRKRVDDKMSSIQAFAPPKKPKPSH